jgi:hypothetical protein
MFDKLCNSWPFVCLFHLTILAAIVGCYSVCLFFLIYFSFYKIMGFIVIFYTCVWCIQIKYTPSPSPSVVPLLHPADPDPQQQMVPFLYSCLFVCVFVFRSRFYKWKKTCDSCLSESDYFSLTWEFPVLPFSGKWHNSFCFMVWIILHHIYIYMYIHIP